MKYKVGDYFDSELILEGDHARYNPNQNIGVRARSKLQKRAKEATVRITTKRNGKYIVAYYVGRADAI